MKTPQECRAAHDEMTRIAFEITTKEAVARALKSKRLRELRLKREASRD